MFGILTWMIVALTLMLCQFIVGIFLIIAGIKCLKSLTIIAGLISISSYRCSYHLYRFWNRFRGDGSYFRNFILEFFLFSRTISYYKRKTNIKYSCYGNNFVYNRSMLRNWLSFFIFNSLKRQKAGKLIPCFSIWFIA